MANLIGSDPNQIPVNGMLGDLAFMDSASFTKAGSSVALTGDVTGTATVTTSGDISIATTIAANSVALGTDTTGNYVAGVTAGTGISVSGTVGEGWSPTITNAAPNVTTDISITHNIDSVVVNSSDGLDGTINTATSSLAGVLSAADKSKLDGIAANANKYSHPTGDGNLHVPATGTTNSGKVLTAGATAGSLSWTSIPAAPVTSVAGKTGVVTLVKGDVGLGNVDNTADSAKAVLSATKLATARTIGGVSFDGTANINLPGVNTTGDQSTTGNAATATKLATARTINGVAFDGTANIIINAVDSTARIAATEKGTANGVATLGADGKVPSTQLPSYVDDVLEFTNLAGFPTTGESGKIYVALDTNKTYRWSGSAYTQITSGAVDSVAGKTGVVTLTKADVGLGNVDNTSDANKPVSTATQTALNAKQATITGAATTITSSNLTASMAMVTDASGKVAAHGTVSATELGYLDGVTSAIQTQLNDKQAALGFTPVQQGGGTLQGTNKMYLGWGSDGSQLRLQVDSTDFGNALPCSITKNAATATKLATARTINGVSFDGSANITINAVDSTARIASSEKGVANGVATLGADGKVPSPQLPSYVDDVLEFTKLASFPTTGESGKIYVALDTNKTYRWSGSAYVYITSGAVDSVAGKTGVVTLVKADVELSNVDNTSDANKPISTATQTALNAKQDTITGAATTIASNNLTASMAMVTDVSGKVAAHGTVSATELGYLDGVTSAIQTQLNGKLSTTGKAADSDLLDGMDSTVFSRRLGNLSSTTIDFNTLISHGTYHQPMNAGTVTYTNHPTGLTNTSRFTLTINDASGDDLVQIISVQDGGGGGRMWKRHRQDSTWFPWIEIWTSATGGSGSGLDADLLDGLHASAFATAAQGTKADAALPATSYTASDVLAKIKTVDGAGSGLDADLLDGVQGNLYAKLDSPTLTGVPTAPTAAEGTNTTQLATTAFVLGNTENSLTSTSTTKALSAAMGNVLYNKTFDIPVKPKIVWDTVNSVYQRPNPTTGVMETLSNPLDMMLTQTLGTQRTVFNHKGNPVVVPNTELFITHNPSTGECLGFPAIPSVANLIYPSEPNAGTYAFGVATDWAQSVITKKGVAYDKLTSTTPLSFSIAATRAECSFGCFVYDDLTTSTGTVSVFKLEYIRSGEALGTIECIYDFATRTYTYTGNVSESNGIPVGFDLPYALGWFFTSRGYSAGSFGVTFTAGDIIKVTINGTGLHYGGLMLRNSFSYNLAYIKTTTAAVTETETKRGISLTSGFVDTHNFTCYMELSRGGIGAVDANNSAYYSLQNATGSETEPYTGNFEFTRTSNANGLPSGPFSAPNKINKVAISVGRNGVMWVAMDGVLLNFSNTANLGIVGNMDKFWFHRDAGSGNRSGNTLHRLFKAWEYQASPAELVAMTAK